MLFLSPIALSFFHSASTSQVLMRVILAHKAYFLLLQTQVKF